MNESTPSPTTTNALTEPMISAATSDRMIAYTNPR
jgi:hypothetical protein